MQDHTQIACRVLGTQHPQQQKPRRGPCWTSVQVRRQLPGLCQTGLPKPALRSCSPHRLACAEHVTCAAPAADALDLRDRFSDLATAGNLNEALTLVRAVVRANRSDVLIRCAGSPSPWLCPRSQCSCMPMSEMPPAQSHNFNRTARVSSAQKPISADSCCSGWCRLKHRHFLRPAADRGAVKQVKAACSPCPAASTHSTLVHFTNRAFNCFAGTQLSRYIEC